MGYLLSAVKRVLVTVLSLLSLSKATTEKWLDASELLILLCGLILAIGAAGEYLEEHDRLPRWMKWSRRPRIVFVWMVALSLVGEFAGDAGVFVFSGHLQTISDGEVATLTEHAADANERAAQADERAGNANKDAGIARLDASNANALAKKYEAQIAASDARVKVAEAEVATAMAKSEDATAKIAAADARSAEASTKAEGFRADIAKANESAATAQAEAANAQLELARLKTPRTLSKAQRARITAKIAEFPDTPYDLFVNTDSDSTTLMGLIDEAIHAAKWKLKPPKLISFGDKAAIIATSGVFIHLSEESRKTLEAPALVLTNALIAEGITVSAFSDATGTSKEEDRATIHVMIGSKPIN